MTLDEEIVCRLRRLSENKAKIAKETNDEYYLGKSHAYSIVADMIEIYRIEQELRKEGEQNEISAITYKNYKEIKTNMYEKLTAEKAENDCRECAAEHRQLAEWLRDLKEAKRLLKSAIDEWNLVCEWGNCGEYCGWYQNGRCTQEWSGKAEALKLIGETNDKP